MNGLRKGARGGGMNAGGRGWGTGGGVRGVEFIFK